MTADKMLWLALFTASLGGGALTGWLTATATQGQQTTRPDTTPREARLLEQVESLSNRLAALEERPVGRSAGSGLPREQVAGGLDEAQVRALVDELLARRGGEAAAVEPADATAAPETPAEEVALLLDLGLQSDEARALWQKAHEQGRLEELLAAFEDWAAAQPESAEVQTELARAYAGAASQDPNHPNGTWWIASDEAYSGALELDPTHWDSRIEKAVSLTHWPDMWGRRPEAIEHFETLIDQARGAAVPQAKHAQPFLWLGNLLAQDGNDDEAGRIWAEGLRRFPDDDDLRRQVEKR